MIFHVTRLPSLFSLKIKKKKKKLSSAAIVIGVLRVNDYHIYHKYCGQTGLSKHVAPDQMLQNAVSDLAGLHCHSSGNF